MQVQSAKDHTSVRPWRAIRRRMSRKMRVGVVEIGGEAPITDRSMTNALTSTGGGNGSGMVFVAGTLDRKMDSQARVDHIVELVEAGAAELAALPQAAAPSARSQQFVEV